MQRVVDALSALRIGHMSAEHELQKKIAEALTAAGIHYIKEYKLGPGSRVDFLAEGVAIEVKKGKPNRTMLYTQIERYASYEEVSAVVIVVETSLYNPITKTSTGKPCSVVGLRKLWGIAL